MALGYDGKLYILAFDHRGSFQKKMFGIEGDPTEEETETISDAKRLIFEGMQVAVERGVDAEATGVLVDEQFGSDIPERAKEGGLKLAMPAEKSGQDEFDFQYDDEFGAHIDRFDPDFSTGIASLNPRFLASPGMSVGPPNCSSTSTPDACWSSPLSAAACMPSQIRCLASAMVSLCSSLGSPSIPNIFFWNDPRWSNARTKSLPS